MKPFPRRHSLTASSFLSARGHLLVALACLLTASGFLPVSAQQDNGQMGATTPTGPIDNTGGLATGSLDFQKSPVNSILDLYERTSGKKLIRDASLDGMPVVSMNATGLSKPEILRMIEATLLLNNVMIIPIDANTVKVVTNGVTHVPKSEGVKIYANAADLPTSDELVSYYMPLNYVNPQEAVGIFSGVAPAHQYGSYTPALSAQAVVLTENTSTIRQLIALKELIDVPPAHVASEWIQLNRADSDKVADILNKMLGLGPTGAPAPNGIPGGGGGGNVIVPPGVGNDQPLSNEHNLISGTIQIVSDPRSNRILLITRPVNLPFLEQMVAQLDQENIFMNPQRRPLKYVLAQDILPALEAALAQGKDEEDQVKKDQTTAQAQNRNGQAGAAGGQQPTSSAGASSGGTGSVSAITPQLSAPNENDVPTVIEIGKTRLMADNRDNSIIVFGSPDIVKRTFDMIDQLDRKPMQVYLATVIGQLTVSEGLDFGIDILQKFQKVGSGGLASSNLNSTQVGGSGGTGFVPEPSALTSAGGFPLPTGLTLYGAIGSTLNAYVRALETTDRFKIISRPSVYTSNNKLAVIASGSQVPVPGTSLSSVVNGATDNNAVSTTTVYENVLLQLDIIPLINANHEVTLQIRQTNNSLGKNVSIGGNLVPIINTQEINTEVTVPNKATVVIGGLITDNTTRDTSGVPWLSDIPVLGYLFKDTNKTKERDELIIMIEPSVIETDADQIAVNEEEKQRTILGREAVEAATGVTEPLPQTGPLTLVPPPTVTTETTHGTVYNSKTGSTNHTTTTTTTSVQKIPTTVMTPLGPTSPTGPVPALSTPAPNVSNGALPKINPPSPPPTGP